MSDVSAQIILVDDEPGVLNALKLLLGALRYKVTEFIDARAALDFIRSADPASHVVVSDLRMPDLDGIQLVAKMRAESLNHPFILMSGHATTEDVNRALKSGANSFLSKPFTPEQFRNALATLRS
jgi:two-component system C4-dicarboxylate transport response regulator DctD